MWISLASSKIIVNNINVNYLAIRMYSPEVNIIDIPQISREMVPYRLIQMTLKVMYLYACGQQALDIFTNATYNIQTKTLSPIRE
jgi:hypothetical protein